jgi:hypothetical protein
MKTHPCAQRATERRQSVNDYRLEGCSGFLVLVFLLISPDLLVIHLKFFQLTRERVAAPAEQARGFLPPAFRFA